MAMRHQVGPAEITENGQHFQTGPSTEVIRVIHVKYNGLRAQPKQDMRVTSIEVDCANLLGDRNTVGSGTLREILGSGTGESQTLQQALSEVDAVTIVWQLRGRTVFETYHDVVPDGSRIYFGNGLNWAKRIEGHNSTLNTTTNASPFAGSFPLASSATASQPSSSTSSPVTTPRSRSRSMEHSPSPMHGPRYSYGSSPLSVNSTATPNTIGRATRRADQRRLNNRLIQKYERYGHDIYMATGDASYIGTALELTRRLAISQFQEDQDAFNGDFPDGP